MSDTRVRGAFKVKGKQPAVYVTENYAGKDSFYYELFHELGHCKSDYNIAKNKVIIEANEEREKRADQFALENMIPIEIAKELKESAITEQNLLSLSTREHIPMSFFVGRLAKEERLAYSNRLYQKYYKQ